MLNSLRDHFITIPDSYVAGRCHRYRAEILEKFGKKQEAEMERKRVNEFYPKNCIDS
jgi:N-acetylmuramoyl-L-alanine amidase